eukprot:9902992-Lingulodinium_polyedra.AAC.1
MGGARRVLLEGYYPGWRLRCPRRHRLAWGPSQCARDQSPPGSSGSWPHRLPSSRGLPEGRLPPGATRSSRS